MFMNGPTIIVHGNADHAPGNTMDDGKIVIHGSGGDVTGHSMRGGRVFVRDDVGYRSGIHMKEYKEKFPVLVIGGTAKDFLGEYMAGGILIVLNIDNEGNDLGEIKGKMIGTGIHGGSIYIRGKVDKSQLGVAADIKEFTEEDRERAWEIFQKYDDKVLSFTDCTSFAVMKRLEIDTAFAVDHDFQALGYIMVPS
jgi:glutamate synthase domain-containing protein 3